MTPPGFVDVTNQAILNDYLNNGGNLYIESTNIGKDHINTEFIDLLGIKYLNDGSDMEVQTLQGGNYFYEPGLMFHYLGGISPHYSCDQLLSDGAELMFGSEDEKGRIFMNEEGGYRTITSSVVIGAIASGDTFNIKPYLLSEMVNYFLGYNPSTGLRDNLSTLLNVGNFPDPFDGSTLISYSIHEDFKVNVSIYDIQGRLIRQLTDAEQKAGNHTVSWDASDNHGNRVSNGYYFAKIIAGNESITEKMIFLK